MVFGAVGGMWGLASVAGVPSILLHIKPFVAATNIFKVLYSEVPSPNTHPGGGAFT